MNEESHPNKTTTLQVPIAIVVAGALIAGAVMFKPDTDTVPQPIPRAAEETAALTNIAKITNADHIRGNPDAPVKIVEYSDFECPFCKRFHETMKRVTNDYGDQVVWVYRHFPLDQLHSKARKEAVAAECAAEQGGNDAFWKFTDRFFELTPSNDQTNTETVLPQIAREIGLDETHFASCLASTKYDAHIEADAQNAIATSGRGTPWSILIAEDGTMQPINGAQPYETVRGTIDAALSNSTQNNQ